MASIVILSADLQRADQWKAMLAPEHSVQTLNGIVAAIQFLPQHSADLMIIDAELLDSEDNALAKIKNTGIKTLILGNNWSEDRQIDVLVLGCSGYCEADVELELLLKAADSILKGDIWIQRHLVPKVIGILVNLNNARTMQREPSKSEFKKNLQTLTSREMDVAKMISAGESNKVIASLLNISERTVKAHLTSIFQKLDVQDRLHLALLLKENY